MKHIVYLKLKLLSDADIIWGINRVAEQGRRVSHKSGSVGDCRHMPADGGNAERARLISLSPEPPPSTPFPGIGCFLSPTISSLFSLTPHSIFCVSRGFMLRPFSDSRQLLRFFHPNISYHVSTPVTTRFLQSVSAFKTIVVQPYEGGYDVLVGLGL
jgi:hypothetical protein